MSNTDLPGPETHDGSDSSEDSRPPTWQERHGATILGAVLAGVFALVLTIQAAC
ncbi:MAG: hypothetical protein H6Q90_1150 [Deltaproteobacteria bacterium]|nr:hypothetical protein [Deltaproteobacteria bacterium]